MTAGGGFIHPEFLIETAELEESLGDPELVLLDPTTHLIPDPEIVYKVVPARADFEKGHIPGAQFVDLQRDLSDSKSRFRFMLPDAESFAAAMGRLGAGGSSRIVLYSSANPWWATRVWWLLRVYGFDNARVLNGGFGKWAAENRPVETGAGRARPKREFPIREIRPLMAGKDDVLRALGDNAVCILNALLPQQHAGTGGTRYGRPGRIKGSLNVPAAELYDPQTGALLPAPELRRRFASSGALDKPVLAYCGGGIAASADAFVLTLLGHREVKIYDASLSEWAIDPSLPMETG